MSAWVEYDREETSGRMVVSRRSSGPVELDAIPFDEGSLERTRVTYGPDGGIVFDRAEPLALQVDMTFEARQAALTHLEGQVLECLRVEVAMRFRAAELLIQIRDQELYRARIDDSTGQPFETFTAYLEAVLEVWRKLDLMNATSRRQMYDIIRVRELFVAQLGLDPDEILRLGFSHFVKLAEALPYERGTYRLLDLPAADLAAQRKLAPAEVLGIVEQIREAKDVPDRQGVEDAPTWTVGATAAMVDQARGIQRAQVVPYWKQVGDRYFLVDLVVYEGDTSSSAVRGGMSEEEAMRVCRRLGSELRLR